MARAFDRKYKLTPKEWAFQNEVKAAAVRLLPEYIAFLHRNLAATSRVAWTPRSLATALQRLGKFHQRIHMVPDLGVLLALFAERLNSTQGDFNGQEVGNSFYGLNGIRTSRLNSRDREALVLLMDALLTKSSRCKKPCSRHDVANTSDEISSSETPDQSDATPASRTVLPAISALPDGQGGCAELSALEIGNALYGLQGICTAELNERGRDVLASILDVLEGSLRKCRTGFGPQELANAIYGLHNIDTTKFSDRGCETVRRILDSLANHIRRSDKWWAAADLCITFQVLHAISQNTSEQIPCDGIAKVFAELCGKLQSSTEGLLPEHISKAIASLQNLDTDRLGEKAQVALAKALESLGDVAIHSKRPFSAVEISQALYGLQGMETGCLDSSGRGALMKLLEALAGKIRLCNGAFSPQALGMSFYGLKGIDTADLGPYGRDVVDKTLTALANAFRMRKVCVDKPSAISICVGIRAFLPKENLGEQDVANKSIAAQAVALAGEVVSEIASVKLNSTDEARNASAVLRITHEANSRLAEENERLWRQVDGFWEGHAGTPGNDADDNYLITLLENQQAYHLYGRPLPASLLALLAIHKRRISTLHHASLHEKTCQAKLEAALGVSVALNQLVHGFELDLSFSVDDVTYNVEIDGPTHRKLSRRLNDKQRDAVLRSNGFAIIRISAAQSVQEAIEAVMSQLSTSP